MTERARDGERERARVRARARAREREKASWKASGRRGVFPLSFPAASGSGRHSFNYPASTRAAVLIG